MQEFLPIVSLTEIKIMNKKAFIKNVIRTTLAEAYEKQANSRYTDTIISNEVLPPVAPLQRILAPIAMGAVGAAIGGDHARRGKSVRGALVGGGVGVGTGLLANYLQALIRKQQIAEVRAGR